MLKGMAERSAENYIVLGDFNIFLRSDATLQALERGGFHVPDELRALQNVMLLPHIGSASVVTRNAMDQLVVDNLRSWFAGKPPLTPVPETPVKAR